MNISRPSLQAWDDAAFFWTGNQIGDSAKPFINPIQSLVGGLVAIFYFPIDIGFLIIPIDFHIFQRGGEKPPTRFN